MRELAIHTMPSDVILNAHYRRWRLNHLEYGDIMMARTSDAPRSEAPFFSGSSNTYHVRLSPLPKDDCGSVAGQLFLVTARHTDQQDVAGYRVLNCEPSDSPEFVSLAFAPDLGCTLLRSTTLNRGRFPLTPPSTR